MALVCNFAAKRIMSILRCILFLMFFRFFICIPVAAQHPEMMESVHQLTGISDMEEMDPDEMHRYERLSSDPLDLNFASDARLRQSGLFSTYQLASLRQYRQDYGNVMSLSELSKIDGFSEDFVYMISPFVSVGNTSVSFLQGQRWNSKAVLRGGLKAGQNLYGLRYEGKKGERISCSFAMNHSYAASKQFPDSFTGNVSFRSRSGRLALVAGAFNARFGQGLAMWNGLTVGGLTSTSGFYKRQTGISPSSSFTGSTAMRGIAAEFSTPLWNVSCGGSMSFNKGFDSCTALNVSRFLPNGRVGCTHYACLAVSHGEVRIPDMKTSVDAAWCIRGTDLFAEACYDWINAKPAFLSGTVFPLASWVRTAVMLRYYPSGYSSGLSASARSTNSSTNEYALSLAGDFRLGHNVVFNAPSRYKTSMNRVTGNISVDVAHFPEPKQKDDNKSFQLKLNMAWTVLVSSSWKVSFRFSERIRSWGQPFKTQLRADAGYSSGKWMANLRADILKCVGTGLLAYLEGGYGSDRYGVYLRQGVFIIDDWDDRIYVYERDAPGSFSVPAFYGRGVWTSFVADWKPARWIKLYLRGSVTSYPFMSGVKKKPGKAELKLQSVFTF